MTSNSVVHVTVKWGKHKYEGIELDLNEGVNVFRFQIYSLTGVPIERQKIMGVKGGILKDDADWAGVGVKDGHVFNLVGTADAIPDLPKDDAPASSSSSAATGAASTADLVYPAGLVNLGNTCYMNATLQMLREVPELYDALRAYKPPPGTTPADVANALTVSGRDLLNTLQLSKQPVNPLIFLTTFQRAYPQFAQRGPGGGNAQQDAEECCSEFLSGLSQRLTIAGQVPAHRIGTNLIDRLFGMEMQATYTNAETDAEPPSTLLETVRKLSCHISIKINFMQDGIMESLDEVVTKRSNLLAREAQYKKSLRISKLPEYALVHFVRFFWKQDTRTRAKVLRPVNFPLTNFDLMNMCTDAVKAKLRTRRDQLRAVEDAAAGLASSSASPADPMAVVLDDGSSADTGLYDLVGVVTHIGRAADSGHYIGWAKHNGKWLCFNDDVVTSVTEDDIKKLSGSGGSDWHIAYMCLYKQKTTLR